MSDEVRIASTEEDIKEAKQLVAIRRHLKDRVGLDKGLILRSLALIARSLLRIEKALNSPNPFEEPIDENQS